MQQGTILYLVRKIQCYNFNKEILTGVNFVPVQFVQRKNAAREVRIMAYDILKSIVEAEARAVEIKKQAVAQAEEMKANALKQQETLLEEARLQGKQEMQKAVENAVAESGEAIRKILKEADAACSQIREQAAEKKEEAVQAVIGKVVGTYGSC